MAEITPLLYYQFLAATLTQGSSDTSVPGDLPPSPSSHGHLGMACERRNVTDLTLKIIDMDPFTCSLYGNKWCVFEKWYELHRSFLKWSVSEIFMH